MYLKPDETLEELGPFRIIQRKKGYRFGIDPFLLVDFALPVGTDERVIDIGTGSGVIPLLLVQRSDVKRVVAVEVQDGLFGLARRNVELNGLEGRIELLKVDYRGLKAFFKERCFDLVISNPPYVKKGCGRVSEERERAIARAESSASMEELVEISEYLVSEGGRVCYIYPISRLKEMLSVMKTKGLNPRRLRPVHPSRTKGAILFMVEATPSPTGTSGDGLIVEGPVYIEGFK